MGLDRLTQSATAIAEENSSGVVENMQAGRPPLQLVQGGLANKPDTGLEGREAQRFHVDGVDRVGDLTILRGEVDGQPRAIVTHIPLELLLPPEPGRPDTAFERLRNSMLGKVAAALALVGAGAAAMAGCAPDNKPKIGSSHAALTAADVDNLGVPALANWTEFGDANNGFQISDIDGATVIIFGRGGDLYSVSCDELEDCLTSGEAVAVEGLPAGTYASGATDQTEGGVNKLIYQIGTTIRQRNISYDATSGVLTITGPSEGFSPSMSGNMTYMKISGVPHVLRAGGGEVYLRNLYTSEDTLLDLDDGPMAICGTPHQADGGIALGSFLYDTGGGLEYCRLVSAPTLNELLDNFIEGSIPSDDGISRTSPRSINNVLIYVQEDPGGTRIYYAIAPIVPPADGGGDADSGPGPTPDSGPGAADDGGDGPGTGADADTGPEADASPGADADAGEDEDADTDPDGPTTPREDGGDTPREDGGDKPKPPDSGPDTPQDNPNECILDPGSVRIIEGSCLFDQCEDQFAQVSGQCTFEVDLGRANPVIIEIDGTYSMDLLERLGGLLRGSYRVVDDGNEVGTVYGDFGTGVSGTTYGGEEQSSENRYRVFCEEGEIVVTFKGEEIARLSGGEELTFDTRTGEPISAEDPNPPGCSCAAPGSEPNSPITAQLGFMLVGLAALFNQGRRKK